MNHRMGRYKWILVEMESQPDSSLTNIELTEWEKSEIQRRPEWRNIYDDASAQELYYSATGFFL